MPCLSRPTVAAFLVASSPFFALAPTEAADAEKWRLFVADHSEPVVRAIDLDGQAASAPSFAIEGAASLHRSKSGRTVFAVQGDKGKVHAIATGIAFDDHGDHGDIEISEPKLLPAVAEGTKPSHLVEHGGRIAIFYDGEGKARLLTEGAFHDGALKQAEIDAGAPHHGAAVPLGKHVVVSVPNADPEGDPTGIRAVDAAGAPVGETQACPDFHGEAPSGRLVAFGCADAVIIAEPGAEGPRFQRLAYPADFPEGHVSTLKGGTALEFFLGNYGPSAVVLIERSADAPFRLVELPTRRVDFAVDPLKPRQAYILTEDGKLHLLDVLSGEITKSVALTEPYSMDGHWRDPRPKLAVAGDHIAVTDPLKSVVRLVSTETLEEERTIPVPGKPYQIVAVGGSGQVH